MEQQKVTGRRTLIWALAASLAVMACGERKAEESAAGGPRPGSDSAAAPAATQPAKVATATGLSHPESALYDPELDLWFVSNINGDPSAKDGNGFISRISPDGKVDSLKFIEGGKNRVTLNGPKGMAIVGDTLWVADIDAVRAFNKRTGSSIATVSLTGKAKFLNDLAVGPDGIYVTDSGLAPGEGGQFGHPGPDVIFRIANRKATVALKFTDQSAPNGIAWDSDARKFGVSAFMSPNLYTWAPGDSAATVIAKGPGQTDGIEPLGGGRFLVSSWADSSLSVVTNGKVTPLMKSLPSPADFAVDQKRHRVAVPSLLGDRVDFIDLGSTP